MNDHPSVALSKRRFLFVFFGTAITAFSSKNYPLLFQGKKEAGNPNLLDSNSDTFNPDSTIHSHQINGWHVSERDIQVLRHLKEIS